MGPQDAIDWARVGREGGGWFVATLLVFVVRVLWKDRKAIQRSKDEALRELQEQKDKEVAALHAQVGVEKDRHLESIQKHLPILDRILLLMDHLAKEYDIGRRKRP